MMRRRRNISNMFGNTQENQKIQLLIEYQRECSYIKKHRIGQFLAKIDHQSKYIKQDLSQSSNIILEMSKVQSEPEFGSMTFIRKEEVKKGEEVKEEERQYRTEKYFKEGKDRSVCRVVEKTKGKIPSSFDKIYVLKRKIMPPKDKEEEPVKEEESQKKQKKVQTDKEVNKNIQIDQCKYIKERYQYLVRYITSWYWPAKGREQLQAFLLMEYCPNGDLSQYLADIKEQSLSPQQITYIVYRVLCGIRILNRMSLMHRDIKLENIVLDRKFQPKIADLELAWRLQSDDSTEMPKDDVGTYDYQAPEVRVNPGKKGYDYSVDIYSLGCVLFRLLFPNSNRIIHKTDPSTILDEIKGKDQFLHELAKEMFEIDPAKKRKDASNMLQEQKFKEVFAKINEKEVQKSLAKKKLGKKKVFVKKVYHRKKIGFLILLSNCRAFIYHYKSEQGTHFEEVTKNFKQIFQRVQKTKLSKNKYLFALLQQHPEAIQDYSTLRISQEYQFISQNKENQVFKQVVNTTIEAIYSPKKSQLFIKLSNGVLQCFFSTKTYSVFQDYLIFNSFRDSKSRVEVASTNSFISKQVKKSSNISNKMSADSSKTFSSINQAKKQNKIGIFFQAVQSKMQSIYIDHKS